MLDVGNLKLNYLDFMMVVNREYTIVYGSRYDLRIHGANESITKDGYLNRNLFEVYPSIGKESSSIIKCMTTGEIVVKKNQKFVDYTGKLFCTHNITLPLIRQGQIVGVVELSKDVTTVDNVTHRSAAVMEGEFDAIAESMKRDVNWISFDAILTENDAMKMNIERAMVLSRLPQPTLIYGETGTGKELFAQAMISFSGIPQKKIIIQNCASVPENLIESILFGTTKGAYTGAENRKGLFEEADNGIFFLDELNSLPYSVQGKLLRVLQDGTFRPVGSNVEKKVDVKIIAAMNVDPVKAIEEKKLRSDLFYRLSSGMIYLPPLRERKDDILFYIDHYIAACNDIYGKSAEGITEPLQDIFLNYSWDGNVRELKNIIESMISISDERLLGVKDLPAYMYDRIFQKKQRSDGEEKESVTKEMRAEVTFPISVCREDYDLKKMLEKTERDLIVRTLKLTGWNKTRAGALLGIPRQTLTYKMNKWGIEEEHW